jgi:hypothetical protein
MEVFMSSRHTNAVAKSIISQDLPRGNEQYDPEEMLLDMNAAYKLAESFLNDPKSTMEQKVRASQMMTFCEIKAKELGIKLCGKGHIKYVKRSELKKMPVTTLNVTPLDIALAESIIVKGEQK